MGVMVHSKNVMTLRPFVIGIVIAHLMEWGAKRQMGCLKGKWGAKRQMGRQKANGAPKGKWGAKRQMGFGNEPMAMKPDEMAMNPWHEAKIKGNEPMA